MPVSQTSKPEYGPFLLASLRGLGEAPRDTVLVHMCELMEARLQPADYVHLHSEGTPRWMNQADHMLDGLIEEGFVEINGTMLRLTEKGRAYFDGIIK